MGVPLSRLVSHFGLSTMSAASATGSATESSPLARSIRAAAASRVLLRILLITQVAIPRLRAFPSLWRSADPVRLEQQVEDVHRPGRHGGGRLEVHGTAGQDARSAEALHHPPLGGNILAGVVRLQFRSEGEAARLNQG